VHFVEVATHWSLSIDSNLLDIEFHLDENNKAGPAVIGDVGNATENTDLTFSFAPTEAFKKKIRDLVENQDDEDNNKDNGEEDKWIKGIEVPFQVLLAYNDLQGNRLLKVLRRALRVTIDRAVTERDINSTAVSLRSIQNAAKLAKDGDYTEARLQLISTMRLLQRAMQSARHQRDYMNFIVQGENLDQFMREAQLQDSLRGDSKQQQQQPQQKKKWERDDESAKAIFQMKSVSVADFDARR